MTRIFKDVMFFLVALACVVNCTGEDTSASPRTGDQLAAESERDMFPFLLSYDAPTNVTDMSFLLNGPIGEGDRIRVKDGHLFNGRGRVRLNGTNLTGPANFPTHEHAERMAARLARFGINCVRLHYMDSSYGNHMLANEPGIIADDPKTNSRFDESQRDKLDYLLAQFRKRGIYVDVNLHVGRSPDARDGFPPGKPKLGRGIDNIDPRLIAYQKDYARELLTHVNPYTGDRLADDQVVALVEISNENALTILYVEGSLDSMSETYAKSFSDAWNAWVVRRYGSGAAACSAWGGADGLPDFDGKDPCRGEMPIVRSHDTVPIALKTDFFRFILSAEHDYWREMDRFLKEEIGLKAPVSGTQTGFSPPHVQADLDIVDSHVYWKHPKQKWRQENVAMVNDPYGGCPGAAAARRVAGKPYIISEYNHPYPAFYGAEGQPMIRAYAAFQDWDGVFQYSYNNRRNAEPLFTEYYFSCCARTDVLAHMPAAAAMFLRGDVATCRSSCVVPFAEDEFARGLALGIGPYQDAASGSQGLIRRHLALVSGLALDVTAKVPKIASAMKVPEKVRASDTGELVWNRTDSEAGYFTVNAANVKFFTGFPKGRSFALGGVTIRPGKTRLGWTTISLLSRLATGFGERAASARILLAATGLSLNHKARISHEAGNLISCEKENWGGAPVMNEGIPAEIVLPTKANRTQCWALDERGERRERVPVIAAADGCARLSIDSRYRTVWYEICVTAEE